MVEPLSLAAVSGALGAVASSMANEAGRSAWESLGGLARRMSGRDVDAPQNASEWEALVRLLTEGANQSSANDRAVRIVLQSIPGLGTATRVPRQLPPSAALFTNHRELLSKLTRQASVKPDGRPRAAQLYGPEGTGSTTLACHWGHREADRFPDGQLYVDLGGAGTVGDARDVTTVARLLLTQLGVDEQDVPPARQDRLGLFHSLLAERRMLVVLDHACSAAQVEPLLSSHAGVFTVVVAHERLGLARALRVEALDRGDAKRLLTDLVGEETVSAAGSAISTLLDRCAGSPLALNAAARLLLSSTPSHGPAPTAPPPSSAQGSLTPSPSPSPAPSPSPDGRTDAGAFRGADPRHGAPGQGTLGPGPGPAPVPEPRSASTSDPSGARPSGLPSADSAPSPDSDPSADSDPPVRHAPDAGSREETVHTDSDDSTGPIRAVAAELYRPLAPVVARIFRLQALWRWPAFGAPQAAHTAGVSESEAADALEELARQQLLESDGAGRYHYRPALRTFAEQAAVAEEGIAACAGALASSIRWYLEFAVRADRAALPHRWQLGPLYRELREEPYADIGAAVAALRAERSNLVQAVHAAEETGDGESARQLCEALWAAQLKTGGEDELLPALRAGLRAAEELHPGTAIAGRAHTQLGLALLELGQTAEAEVEFRAAERTEATAGHARGRATALESVGLVRLRLWRYREALDLFTEADMELSAIRHGEAGTDDVPRGRALLERHTGRALRGLARREEAEQRLQRALAFFRETGESYNTARTLTDLAELRIDAEEIAAAVPLIDEALTLLTSEEAGRHMDRLQALRDICVHEAD